jgi:hypothetical protein
MDREKAKSCADLHMLISKYIMPDYDKECILVVFERFIVNIILSTVEPKKLFDEFIEKLNEHYMAGPDGF